MSTAIDLTVQDANVLLTTLKKYQPQLSEFGVTEGGIQEYENLVATLQQKDLAYKAAQNTKRQFTIEQNLQVERAREIIKKVKTASQVAFFNDKGKLLDFHKGKAIPSTVSGLVAETLYLKETAGLNTEALQARGIKAADLAELETCHSELTRIDNAQEDAKHSQKTLREERDAAMNDLKAAMFRMRKSAEVCFMKNKTALAEFRSIIPVYKSTKTVTTAETEPQNP